MAKDKNVSRIHLEGGDAWIKQYGDDRRVVRLRAMDWVARKLSITHYVRPRGMPARRGATSSNAGWTNCRGSASSCRGGSGMAATA